MRTCDTAIPPILGQAGFSRVWSLLGDASITYQIGHVRSADFWKQVASHIELRRSLVIYLELPCHAAT